jgi:hypothetical protein
MCRTLPWIDGDAMDAAVTDQPDVAGDGFGVGRARLPALYY